MATTLKLKICEMDATPVLGYLNRMAKMRQDANRTVEVFEEWPSVCLGYTHVIMMSTKDAFPMFPRRKPYFHLIESSLLEKISPAVHKKIYNTYMENDPEWKPYINAAMRTTDYILTPTPETFVELADTARLLCLVNTGKH